MRAFLRELWRAMWNLCVDCGRPFPEAGECRVCQSCYQLHHCPHKWRPAILRRDEPCKYCDNCGLAVGIDKSEFFALFGPDSFVKLPMGGGR